MFLHRSLEPEIQRLVSLSWVCQLVRRQAVCVARVVQVLGPDRLRLVGLPVQQEAGLGLVGLGGLLLSCSAELKDGQLAGLRRLRQAQGLVFELELPRPGELLAGSAGPVGWQVGSEGLALLLAGGLAELEVQGQRRFLCDQ